MMSNNWGGEPMHPVMEEFARGVHLMGLEPCVLVDYHREGYASRFGDDIRMTFDRHVQSVASRTLFPGPGAFFRLHHTHEVVLEVKFRQKPPLWLKPIVQQHGLRLVANSKFTQAMEAARQDHVYPGGVLVVR